MKYSLLVALEYDTEHTNPSREMLKFRIEQKLVIVDTWRQYVHSKKMGCIPLIEFIIKDTDFIVLSLVLPLWSLHSA